MQPDKAQCELDRYVEEVRGLLSDKLQVGRNEKQYIKKSHKCAIGDFLEKSQMLQWAGISFGDSETYRIYKSMQRLSKLTGATSLRFWGKIFASKHDYFVVEGELKEVEETELSKNCEPRGQGVNKYVYWVTDNILSDWIQLPEANPEHIKASKKIKHIMTGDLNAEVLTSPPFPGKERHFLRAQIARIAHATTLFPKGMIEPNEEQEGELMYAEEFTMPSLAELNSTEAWGHHYPNILNAGRITHQAPDVPEDQVEEELAKLEEEDKVLEKLMGINEDAPIPPLESAWLMKIVGDDQPYNPEGEEEGTLTYAANVIKSLRWPGAYTVAYNGDYTNIYIGYGLKSNAGAPKEKSYSPTSPPDVMEDPSETPEMPEPTPLEAPEEPLEPDTDEENKKEGEDE
jgi:hypothetical protein